MPPHFISCIPIDFFHTFYSIQGLSNLGDSRGGGEREARNAADGVLEGGKAFTQGLLKGVLGIVTKPIQGASRGGLSGFIEGASTALCTPRCMTCIRRVYALAAFGTGSGLRRTV